MNMLTCRKYLGFDDRLLMFISIPILSVVMPFILKEYLYQQKEISWVHYILETFFFVLGFWIYFRWLLIILRKKYPGLNESVKRLILEVLLFLLSAPLLKLVLTLIIKSAHLCYSDPNEDQYLEVLLNIYFPSALMLSIYEASYYFNQFKESLLEKEGLQRMHIQTELENLRNQINPHFLFNSLNTLMNLISADPAKAQEYLRKLSRFYRHTVGANDEVLIPLSKELECAKLYAELLKERFGDKLSIVFEGPEIRAMIPPLSLQLLIENAVKHNVVMTDRKLHITILNDSGNRSVSVANNIQKRTEEVSSTGMGIQNIKKRFSYFTDRAVEVFEDASNFRVNLPLLDS